MDFTIASWNVGGVDFLRTLPRDRASKRERFNADLCAILSRTNPDVLVIQETVRYGLEHGPRATEELFDEPDGYHYACSIAMDTKHNAHPVKWTPIRDSGRWATNTYLGQGYGICWRSSMPHCSIWETNHELARVDTPIEKEDVRIESGLFTGNRDTEPRLVVVAHFVSAHRDVFIVNAHFTTLRREREGFPERDDRGSKLRHDQVEIVLHGVVSRLNEYRQDNAADQRVGIWFLAGDFNATPDAPEISTISRMNFARLCNDDPTKRSRRGGDASIKVDYIFVGPKYYAFDPCVLQQGNDFNQGYQILEDITSSDHYPIVARFPLG